MAGSAHLPLVCACETGLEIKQVAGYTCCYLDGEFPVLENTIPHGGALSLSLLLHGRKTENKTIVNAGNPCCSIVPRQDDEDEGTTAAANVVIKIINKKDSRPSSRQP